MAAPGNWTIYNDYLLAEGQGQVNLTSDTLMLALFTSASSAINAAVPGATYTAFAANGHEVANGNGYATGGVAVPSVSWIGGGANPSVLSGGTVSWIASGAGFTARAAVLYDASAGNKPAIAYFLLDSTPADVTISAGNPLVVNAGTVLTKT